MIKDESTIHDLPKSITIFFETAKVEVKLSDIGYTPVEWAELDIDDQTSEVKGLVEDFTWGYEV